MSVHHYNKALEHWLGKSEFPHFHEKLRNDKNMTKDHMVQLAKEFSKKRTRSRKAALGAIYQRHANIMSMRAKIKAIGGRSAA